MMRIFRFVITAIFIVVTAVFGYFFFTESIGIDKTLPEIKVEGDVLEVEAGVSDRKLLKGVTAYDKKDGDLTSDIIVESISKFTEKGVCNVTYAVCDSDNHVANATRKIKYVNYKSPEFKVKGSLCFSVDQYLDITGMICAEDYIDGDISSSIIITSSDFENDTAGVYTLDAKVTNSKGDTVTARFPLIIEERSLSAPVLVLTDYYIKVDRGETPDFTKYFKRAETPGGEKIGGLTVRVRTDFNPDEEGLQLVHYYATDETGRRGHSVLMVMVEG